MGGTEEPECTLKSAIEEANATAGGDTILFNIPGSAPYKIRPRSGLPEIEETLAIDGWSQPGGAGVVLDGTNAGSGASGLYATGGDLMVTGLDISGYSAHGIHAASGDVTVGGTGSEIRDNGGYGIRTDEGAVTVQAGAMSSIERNGEGGILGSDGVSLPANFVVEDNGGPGIVAAGEDGLSLENVKVRNNQGDGIGYAYTGVWNMSRGPGHGIFLQGADNEISDNAGCGLRTQLGDVTIRGSALIGGNGEWGIRAEMMLGLSQV